MVATAPSSQRSAAGRRTLAPLLSTLTAAGTLAAVAALALAPGQVILVSSEPERVTLSVAPETDTVVVRWMVEPDDVTAAGGNLTQYLLDTITVGDADGAACSATSTPALGGTAVELHFDCAAGTDVVDVALTAFTDLEPGRIVEVAGPEGERFGYSLEQAEHTWRLG